MRGLEIDWRRDATAQRFFVACGAETPFVAGFEAGKIPFRMRRHQIVSLKDGIIQEFARDLHTNRMLPDVFRPGPAISITIKSRHRIAATAAQLRPKNIRHHAA